MFGDDDLRAEEGKPRVEGKAVRRPLDRTLVRLYAEFTDAECATHGDAGVVIRDLALDLLDARNEVKRLTKEKARACQMAFEEGAIWGYTGPTGAAIQAEAELRYPRPTSETK